VGEGGGWLVLTDGELSGVAGGDGGEGLVAEVVGVVSGLSEVGAGGHDITDVVTGDAAGEDRQAGAGAD
jgi:hypothetical protein